MLTHLCGSCSSHFHKWDKGDSPAHCGASGLSEHHEHTDGGTHTDTVKRGETTSRYHGGERRNYIMLIWRTEEKLRCDTTEERGESTSR